MANQLTFDFGTSYVAANDPAYSTTLFKLARKDRDYYRTFTANRQWRLVMERAGWRCQACRWREQLEIDHIIPIEAGGDQYCLANQQVLCKRCHALKTSMDFLRYGWQGSPSRYRK